MKSVLDFVKAEDLYRGIVFRGYTKAPSVFNMLPKIINFGVNFKQFRYEHRKYEEAEEKERFLYVVDKVLGGAIFWNCYKQNFYK